MGNWSGRRSGMNFQIGGMPVWGIVGVLAVLAVVAVATITNLPDRAQSVSTQATPRPAMTVEQRDTGKRVSVVGDSYTGGSGMDSGAAVRWPANLSGYNITTFHEGGTGYAATLDTASGPSNFVTRVADMPTGDIQRLVFFGSINDGREGYDATYEAASQAFGDARAKWPTAQILVIGPASPRWPVPAEYNTARNAARDAAGDAQLTFVDPIELGWFDGTPELIGSDNTHPTDAGHAYLAQRMQEVFDANFPN